MSVIKNGLHAVWFDISPLPQWVYDRTTLKFLNVNNAAIRHYGDTRIFYTNEYPGYQAAERNPENS